MRVASVEVCPLSGDSVDGGRSGAIRPSSPSPGIEIAPEWLDRFCPERFMLC